MSIQRASSSNPGIPPSSLMSFLRANSSIAGAVLAEFDSAYSNPAYATEADVGGQISSGSIAAAATLTAQTLYRLAGGSGPLQVNPHLSDVHHLNKLLHISGLLCTQCMGLNHPLSWCRLIAKLSLPRLSSWRPA